jgi:thiamine biosynthesis protein ThiI
VTSPTSGSSTASSSHTRMFERAVLVHYHEIGLKGRNRAKFERMLLDNIAASLTDIPEARVEKISSRLLVRFDVSERVFDIAEIDRITERVAMQPGVAYAAPVFISSKIEHDMNAAALLALREAGAGDSFRIEARRSNTSHPISSLDMNIAIGQHVVDETGLAVNLGKPEITVWIEVVQGESYIFSRKFPGSGGLPVGSGGKVISLLSSGIDSPVASWRLLKRGAVVVGLHFSGRPQTDDRSEHNVAQIGEVLQRYGGVGRIYFVPFGDLQREISLMCPPDLRVLLYRRLMIRVAEVVAKREGALALVTGESLGQVASQTLENIRAVDDAATLPILRPLIGMDKVEIIRDAERIGTFEISIQDHTDCCTLFMPRRPSTRASIKEVVDGEAELDMERMISDAIESMTWRDYACPAYRKPKG